MCRVQRGLVRAGRAVAFPGGGTSFPRRPCPSSSMTCGSFSLPQAGVRPPLAAWACRGLDVVLQLRTASSEHAPS